MYFNIKLSQCITRRNIDDVSGVNSVPYLYIKIKNKIKNTNMHISKVIQFATT